MRQILYDSFFQLLIVYAIVASLVTLDLLDTILALQLGSIIIAVVGVLVLKEQTDSLPSWLIYPALAVVAVTRIIPYVGNTVPLGYDAGIYKYVFEFHAAEWINAAHPPLLKFLVAPFMLLGDWFVLVPLFIIIDIALCYVVYLCVKEWFGKDAGILAGIFFALSYTQFLAFWFLYYKNVVALLFMLLAWYVYKKVEKTSLKYSLFIVFGILVGGIHRPTFLVFMASLGLYIVAKFFEKKKTMYDVLSAVVIGVFTIMMYLPVLDSAILSFLPGIATASIGAGTFVAAEFFFIYSISYLPFALLGLLWCIKNKQNSPFMWFIGITGLIVIAKLIFYNRFIIHLDLAMLIIAGVGASYVLQHKLGKAALIMVVLISGYSIIHQAAADEPLISEEEWMFIKSIADRTEQDAIIVSTHRHYSPWLLGYSGREVLAPKLFGDRIPEEAWIGLVSGDEEEIFSYLDELERPVYVYIGEKQNLEIEHPCFEGEQLLKYVC